MSWDELQEIRNWNLDGFEFMKVPGSTFTTPALPDYFPALNRRSGTKRNHQDGEDTSEYSDQILEYSEEVPQYIEEAPEETGEASVVTENTEDTEYTEDTEDTEDTEYTEDTKDTEDTEETQQFPLEPRGPSESSGPSLAELLAVLYSPEPDTSAEQTITRRRFPPKPRTDPSEYTTLQPE